MEKRKAGGGVASVIIRAETMHCAQNSVLYEGKGTTTTVSRGGLSLRMDHKMTSDIPPFLELLL